MVKLESENNMELLLNDVIYERHSGKGYLFPPADFSESFGLLFVNRGEVEVVLGSEVVKVTEQNAVVLPEKVTLFAYAEKDSQIEVLTCPTVLLQKMMQKIDAELFSLFMLQSRMRPYLITPDALAYAEAKEVLLRADTETQAKEPCYQLMLHGETGRLMASLLRQYAGDKTADDRLLYHNLSRMKEALLYMEEHLQEKIALASLGEIVHLSPDYFSHLLDVSTGKTAKQYLQALRMNKAMGLLVQTKLSVEAVAEQVGYKGSTFFSSLFSRTVGMSPSDYRALFS